MHLAAVHLAAVVLQRYAPKRCAMSKPIDRSRRGKISAPELARRWGLKVKQARYGGWGNWYGPLDRFPAALLDENGYYLVPERRDLEIERISVGKEINVRGGHLLPTWIRQSD
jgi:hypothetical protein